MRKYEKVKYTKPIELFGLIFSTVFVFSGIIIVLNELSTNSIIKIIISFLVSGIYFFALKKLIIKSADFKLTSHQLEWNNETVDFDNVKSYKIHWIKGAGLKLTLMDGTIKRLSSNSNFCNSEKFVELMQELNNTLIKYKDGKIERENTIMQTKLGLYLAIGFTTFFIGVLIHSLITGKILNLSTLVLFIVGLITIWSGIIIKN